MRSSPPAGPSPRRGAARTAAARRRAPRWPPSSPATARTRRTRTARGTRGRDRRRSRRRGGGRCGRDRGGAPRRRWPPPARRTRGSSASGCRSWSCSRSAGGPGVSLAAWGAGDSTPRAGGGSGPLSAPSRSAPELRVGAVAGALLVLGLRVSTAGARAPRGWCRSASSGSIGGGVPSSTWCLSLSTFGVGSRVTGALAWETGSSSSAVSATQPASTIAEETTSAAPTSLASLPIIVVLHIGRGAAGGAGGLGVSPLEIGSGPSDRRRRRRTRTA